MQDAGWVGGPYSRIAVSPKGGRVKNDKARRPFGQPGFKKAPCDGALAPSSVAG